MSRLIKLDWLPVFLVFGFDLIRAQLSLDQ